MKDRIKELAEQAGLYIAYDNRAVTDKELERFAELVAADAVAKEREACAKLCAPTPLRPCDCYSCDCGDKDAAVRVAEWDLQWSMAKAIRSRSDE